MPRILILVIFGFVFASTALRAIRGAIALILNLTKGGDQAPEILGPLTASIVISLVFGWLFRKVYLQKVKTE